MQRILKSKVRLTPTTFNLVNNGIFLESLILKGYNLREISKVT